MFALTGCARTSVPWLGALPAQYSVKLKAVLHRNSPLQHRSMLVVLSGYMPVNYALAASKKRKTSTRARRVRKEWRHLISRPRFIPPALRGDLVCRMRACSDDRVS